MGLGRQRIRDFHEKRITNPLFSKPKASRLKKIGISALMFLLAAGVGYGLVYSPLLRVEKIKIEGLETVAEEQVVAAARQETSGYLYGIFPRDHFFLIRNGSVEQAIYKAPLLLRSVQVRRSFRSLIVTVEERRPTYRLLVGERAYLLDQDGNVLREAQPAEGENLIALTNADKSKSVVIGEAVFPLSWAPFINNLHNYFATQVGIRDRLYTLDQKAETVSVMTVEEWYVLLDPSLDLTKQLSTLSASLVNKFGPEERAKLQYIDVRFGERVFYKWK